MTRVLLTLLALLTGLVAQIAPVQARIGGAAGAEVAVQLPSISKRAAVVRQVTSIPATASNGHKREIGTVSPRQTINAVPVLVGIDRARE